MTVMSGLIACFALGWVWANHEELDGQHTYRGENSGRLARRFVCIAAKIASFVDDWPAQLRQTGLLARSVSDAPVAS
jgi:hypothetical protein